MEKYHFYNLEEGPDYPYAMVEATRSIAISLKRIADALDDGSSVTLLDTLRGIEMNGRQN